MQRLLDVFAPLEAAEPASPADPASPVVPPPPGPPVVPAQTTHMPLPAAEPPGAWPTAAFRHPQAQRALQLGDVVVAYALQRARRRSIGFSVGPEGLAVRAPLRLPLAAVDDAVRRKSGWILRKLGEAQARQKRQAQARIDWQGDTVLPWLGAALWVRRDPAAPAAGLLQALAAPGPGGAGQALHLRVPQGASPEQLRAATQRWCMQQARAHFTARLEHFAPLLGVHWRSLRLSSARTRWGSAKSDGSIRLNWRLLHYPPETIDYVVAHELAHLRVMDHSPRFWGTVASVVPDYVALRQSLRDTPPPPWDEGALKTPDQLHAPDPPRSP